MGDSHRTSQPAVTLTRKMKNKESKIAAFFVGRGHPEVDVAIKQIRKELTICKVSTYEPKGSLRRRSRRSQRDRGYH